MVNDKKPSSKHRVDILESRPIRLTENYFDSEDGRKVPMVVKDAWKKLRGEILSLRREVSEDEEKLKYTVGTKKKTQSGGDGHHPAVTGLSIGGAKEVVDYFLDIAAYGDKVAQGFLDLPFIDGGITAIIATCAAFFARGSRNK